MNKNVQDMNKIVKMLSEQISKKFMQIEQKQIKNQEMNDTAQKDLKQENKDLLKTIKDMQLKEEKLEQENKDLKQSIKEQRDELTKKIKAVEDNSKLAVLNVEAQIDSIIERRLLAIHKAREEREKIQKEAKISARIQQPTPAIKPQKKVVEEEIIPRKRKANSGTQILGLFNTDNDEF